MRIIEIYESEHPESLQMRPVRGLQKPSRRRDCTVLRTILRLGKCSIARDIAKERQFLYLLGDIV
jgi:hypothetical protein